MNLTSEISSRIQTIPWVRRQASRYGRAYWRLPKVLRKKICWEEDLSKKPGVSCVVVGEAEKVKPISHPVLRSPPTHSHRLTAQGFTSRSPVVARVTDAWLVGTYATPVTSNGDLLLTAFRDAPRILGLEPHLDLEVWMERRGWHDKADVTYENVFPMTNRLEGNYFHWLVEWCGRLEWMENYRAITGECVKLLIPAEGPSYIRESLKLLGWGPDTWISWPKESSAARVRNLLLPSFRGSTLATSPEALRWLRTRLLKGANAEGVQGKRKIYVPRRPGMWRAVANSDAVESRIRELGWDILEPHLMSLAEQIRTFFNAGQIAGLHGSGLTNILFAPSAVLFEWFGSYGDGVWFGMTTRLNQRYYAMQCARINSDDVEVDILNLENRIRDIAD